MKILLFFLLVRPISAEVLFRPIDEIEIKPFYSSQDNIIPLSEGLDLKKGANAHIYEKGYIKNGKSLALNYEFHQKVNEYLTRSEIHKLYLNLLYGKLNLSLGKNSKNIGPSENSLILSKNAPPFTMLDIELSPINWHGKWKFDLLKGWLNENRKDISNPELLLLRIDYSPSETLDLSLNRFSQYGGDSLEKLKIWEYPKFITGAEDNVSFSKYDSDGYFGFDIGLNLEKYFKKFDKFKFYYQQIATDIVAPWQKEDKGDWNFPFIVKLTLNSYQTGVEIVKSKNIYTIEFTSINDLFYVHHYYWYEGYSYKGFSLGNPYGRHLFELYFKHKILKQDKDYFQYKAGIVKQPSTYNSRTIATDKIYKFYLETEYSKKAGNKTFLSPYLRLEYSNNYDANAQPMQFDIKRANKLFLISGITLKMKF